MNWGNCDYKQLQRLRDSLATLQSMDMDRFCTEVSKELAARLLALVIPRTPVGQYPKSSGKKGGTLRFLIPLHSLLSFRQNQALKSAGRSLRRPKCHKIASAMRAQAWPSP